MFFDSSETITIKVGTLLLLLERLGSYLLPLLIRRREGETSGAMHPSEWKREFRDAIDEKLEQRVLPLMEKMVEGHQDVVNLLKDRTAYFQQQTDLLKELVEVSRNRRRR